jgi:hypothetical protein
MGRKRRDPSFESSQATSTFDLNLVARNKPQFFRSRWMIKSGLIALTRSHGLPNSIHAQICGLHLARPAHRMIPPLPPDSTPPSSLQMLIGLYLGPLIHAQHAHPPNTTDSPVRLECFESLHKPHHAFAATHPNASQYH